LIGAILVNHRENREVFIENRCSVPIRVTQRIRKTYSHLSLSFPKLSYFLLFTFYAHKPTASGTKIILHILDSNLTATLRLTQSSWIRIYFYYFDSFSTLPKSLSSFWRCCRGLLNYFNEAISLLFRIFVYILLKKIVLVVFILCCVVL